MCLLWSIVNKLDQKIIIIWHFQKLDMKCPTITHGTNLTRLTHMDTQVAGWRGETHWWVYVQRMVGLFDEAKLAILVSTQTVETQKWVNIQRLDGVSPVDRRPFPMQLHQ